MKTNILVLIAAGGALLSLVACTLPSRGTVYDRNRIGGMQRVEMGTVVTVKNIVISGERGPVGMMGGGMVGHAAGSAVGQGTGAKLASAGGAVMGAVAGQAVEEAVTRRAGIETTVQLDNGEKVVIVQEGAADFITGDRVQVLHGGGPARVVRPGA
jgi:outer membrane lipoprotein SlyB